MTPTKDQQAQEYAEKYLTDICLMMDYEEDKQIGYFHTYDIQQAYSDGYTACEQSMWRSVEDELPEDGETVLLSINGSRLTGYYSHDDELWEVDGIGAYERNAVSHWCKLPSLHETNTEKK